MTAISFSLYGSERMILSGRKNTTIRPYSAKRLERIVDKGNLELYWKQRTKECRKICDAELTDYCIIDNLLDFVQNVLTDDEIRSEGFDERYEMIEFFCQKYSSDQLCKGTFVYLKFETIKPEADA